MKEEAMAGLKQMVEGFRPQAESLGMGDTLHKLDAALLLEDGEYVLKYSSEMLLKLREVFVAQIELIDRMLKQ
jgi:hypothetical protein